MSNLLKRTLRLTRCEIASTIPPLFIPASFRFAQVRVFDCRNKATDESLVIFLLWRTASRCCHVHPTRSSHRRLPGSLL